MSTDFHLEAPSQSLSSHLPNQERSLGQSDLPAPEPHTNIATLRQINPSDIDEEGIMLIASLLSHQDVERRVQQQRNTGSSALIRDPIDVIEIGI